MQKVDEGLLEDVCKCLKTLSNRNTESYEKLQKATKKAMKLIKEIESKYIKK